MYCVCVSVCPFIFMHHSVKSTSVKVLKCTRLLCIREQEVITLFKIIQCLSDRLLCDFTQVSTKYFAAVLHSFPRLVVDDCELTIFLSDQQSVNTK